MVLLYLFIVERNGFVKKIHFSFSALNLNCWLKKQLHICDKNLAKQKNMDTL